MAEITKTVGGKKYPAGDWLVVEDANSPSTWHLQVKRNGTPDHGLMGNAYAALFKTFRGNSYDGPNKQQAITKLKALYKAEKMEWPGDTKEAIYFEAAINPVQTGEQFEGREWEVTIIGAKTPTDIITVNGAQYLKSLNNRLYSLSALADSAPTWEGVKVYDNHLTDAEFNQKQGMRSPVKEWLGTIVNTTWDAAANRLTGIFKVVEASLAAKLKSAWEQNVLNSIGLSIDTFPIILQEAMVEGVSMPIVEGFRKILSVDLVGDPAAGGGFNRLIASQTQERVIMDEEQVKELVKKLLAEGLAAVPAEPPAPPTAPEPAPAAPQTDPAVEAAAKAAQEALAQAKLLASEALVTRKLEAAKLPEAYRKVAETTLFGKVVDEAMIDAVIKQLKEAQASDDPTGRANGTGQARPQVTFAEADKYAVEFARLLMGNSDFAKLRADKVDPMIAERLGEADFWKAWEKDGFSKFQNASRISTLLEQWFGGNPLIDPRAMETASTSTLATVVKNTVNIMVAADYSVQQRWYEPLVRTEEVDTIDDSTLARLYGVNTLSIVPEGDTYTELALADEEETATFVKKGNYIGITMETLMRDKLNYVRTIPRRLSDTWFNTLSALVAGVWTVNSAAGPVLSDTGALFNATATSSAGGHANLLTTALSHAQYSVARIAMQKQTNQPLGAGRRLLIEPRYLLVPSDLETTGLQIRNSEKVPGSANETVNPFYQKFDVVVVPDWTDTNNWGLMADPAQFPAIWLIFPRGNRTPQLFTADSEVAGAMFTNDVLRFKVRMLSYHFSSTYDCAPVADFRPLFNNIVA